MSTAPTREVGAPPDSFPRKREGSRKQRTKRRADGSKSLLKTLCEGGSGESSCCCSLRTKRGDGDGLWHLCLGPAQPGDSRAGGGETCWGVGVQVATRPVCETPGGPALLPLSIPGAGLQCPASPCVGGGGFPREGTHNFYKHTTRRALCGFEMAI